MKWNRFTLKTKTEAEDIVSSMLADLGIEGVEIEDKIPLTESDKEQMFVDILPETGINDGIAYISFYLEEDQDKEEMLASVRNELEEMRTFMEMGDLEIEESQTEDVDWVNNWKKFFKPIRLDEQIVIKPTWETLEDQTEDMIVVEIDPGTAFGTGSHETTRLCIGQLKKYMKDGDEILDAGSGSGILSFVCNKLGAKHVLGIDIDPIAVDVAGENRDVNHIPAEAVEFKCGNVLEDQKLVESIGANYDIVVANILADVIIPMSAVVQKFMKDDGIFISSGIINIKEDEVRQALLDNNFDIVDTVYMNDWVSFVAKKHV